MKVKAAAIATVTAVTAPRRSQGERTTATRAALVAAGRRLFAAEGFRAVSIESIVRAAGVTRGAMYHHFADKTELFAAVFESVEAEVTQRIDAAVSGIAGDDPIPFMKLGANAWLDICAEPDIRRIVLVDAPAALGYERWREISMGYGMGLVMALVEWAISAGRLPPQPAAPFAHVMLGALDEAVLYISRSDDPVTARREVGAVIERLIEAHSVGEPNAG